MNYDHLKDGHPELYGLLKKETERQKQVINLIASENYVSPAVLEALGTELTNKYSEGYPGKRYYFGNEIIDEVERLAQGLAKKLFGVPHANVQPYSGSPANLAVYVAVCKPGDTVMGLNLPDGGHLTHGWKASATAMFYRSVPYHVRPDGRIDIDEVRRLAREHRPKIIWVGATAYPYCYDFAAFAEIADDVGAYCVADIAHVAGLIVAGVHPDPVPHAHIITTTTHKTLRGPRGGMIMVTQRGIEKDPELQEKVDRAVFPMLQGGPHNHQTAAIAVALAEAGTDAFKAYGAHIVANAKALAEALVGAGFALVSGGTENHMMLVDLTPLGMSGKEAGELLERAGIIVNKNAIPGDSRKPWDPSGIRLGTPAVTTRGMKEPEMLQIGAWIKAVLMDKQSPESVASEVKKLTARFPV